mmetsp:Transcript_15856/g.36422  ORF Transcript_15856/g.36422 Transcript_15856/m.36422 type:complete len:109 (+) Transcript_15856:304-630(+)
MRVVTVAEDAQEKVSRLLWSPDAALSLFGFLVDEGTYLLVLVEIPVRLLLWLFTRCDKTFGRIYWHLIIDAGGRVGWMRDQTKWIFQVPECKHPSKRVDFEVSRDKNT